MNQHGQPAATRALAKPKGGGMSQGGGRGYFPLCPTHILPSLVVLLLMAPSLSAASNPHTYDTKRYGFDLENWAVICQHPVRTGEVIEQEVFQALQREGWLESDGSAPNPGKVNHQCAQLRF